MGCNKNYQNKFDKKLKEQFFNTYKFSNHDNNKFILLLRKGVYPYSHLNMEDITDADYVHAKRVCKDFEIKNLGEYHDLYVKGDTLLLADAYENFKNICLTIYVLDSAKKIFSVWISIASSFKKDRSKIRSFN